MLRFGQTSTNSGNIVRNICPTADEYKIESPKEISGLAAGAPPDGCYRKGGVNRIEKAMNWRLDRKGGELDRKGGESVRKIQGTSTHLDSGWLDSGSSKRSSKSRSTPGWLDSGSSKSSGSSGSTPGWLL